MPTVSPHTKFWLAVSALAALFLWPLYLLLCFALQSALYSYVLLVPVVSLVLIKQQKHSVPNDRQRLSGFAFIPLVAGAALLVWYGSSRIAGQTWLLQNYLSLMVSAWLLFSAALCLWFRDKNELRALAFPLVFLVFMVPLPLAVENGLETFLQHGSALAACLFFKLAGMSYVYEDLTFHLPAFNMHVAPECSGIHSSLILFITSTLAAQLFLRSRWTKAVLVLAVIPLALLRNGFRAFVIGELCVQIGPEMSDSWIHRRGGPLFFILSLVPLLLLLYSLIKLDRRTSKQVTA